MDLNVLFDVAHRHQITAMAAMALEDAGVKIPRFTQAKGKAIRKNAALDLDRTALTKRLDEEKIWYMPLKGALLAAYYPQYGMRQMSDNDILIDPRRDKDVRRIMISLGFTVEKFGKGMHDEYYKKPVSYFEIHRTLFDMTDRNLYDYYRDVASRLIQEDGTCERRFSPEDFYIYLIAHEYRHFSHSGTGLRSLLDVYLFWKKHGEQLDGEYIEKELAKIGIVDFERQNKKIALRLFSGEALSDLEEELLREYILSGVYGTVKNKITRQGRWRFFRTNVFLSYDQMVILYPILKRLPVLLPICWLLRIVRKMVTKPGRIRFKLKSIWHFGKNQGK
jgi:hypothetical protein